jgi:hypothetical protein
MSEKSAFLAKLFLRALCASARVSGQRDFGCGFPRCAFAFGLGLLVTARRFEKRRWRSALQDLAALRKRPLNAPASWSAEREFRFGHKRGPEPSFIQRPECQGNGKKSFQNDAPAHHSRDKHSVIGFGLGGLCVAMDEMLKGFSLRAFSAATFGLFLGSVVAWLIDRSGLFADADDPQRRVIRLACS